MYAYMCVCMRTYMQNGTCLKWSSLNQKYLAFVHENKPELVNGHRTEVLSILYSRFLAYGRNCMQCFLTVNDIKYELLGLA